MWFLEFSFGNMHAVFEALVPRVACGKFDVTVLFAKPDSQANANVFYFLASNKSIDPHVFVAF